MTRDEGRAASKLHGRLAEIFLPSLLGADLEPLSIRLGERATVTFPWASPTVGLETVKKQLQEESAWLAKGAATYKHDRTVIGHDRDIAEGQLSMKIGGRDKHLRIAVLCVRRPAREVDVRVFLSSEAVGRAVVPGTFTTPEASAVSPDVSAHLGAIRFGDASQILETFETESTLVDALGDVHDRASGALRKFYEERLPVAPGSTTWVPAVHGVADTGRIVAVEYETSGTGKLGMLVLERGESGLFREARLYDDLGGTKAS